MQLEETFQQLTAQYTNDKALTHTLWQEIVTAYSNKKRHYHNVAHLQNLLEELVPLKHLIRNWNLLLSSVYYHDIVYNTLKTDNEERSAALAVKRLHQLGLNKEEIALCQQQIIATKSHTISTNQDTNLFTDADLSVLGKDAATYITYSHQIRQEYKVYPDFMYNPGRKKVLQHFLQMESIYKTPQFREQYEEQARSNLQDELSKY
jgi:predicted metal-dependent HD superfamily phosphohydrolase